ncbi:hypothetical protein TNIN_491451 [Trichonephila inaurata madagascariensis]|uniref:ATP-dependent DNA helicase n=1 Tax=Trichonephila inaurata madagascariensis TaxID=2747483 RepID=A0A8X7BYT9_9ARAC|nr:hypothetical protein TNIN_491451 [Trichonephila inaurata madagascariensis]
MMSHKKTTEALNWTLQDLRRSTDIIGGMVVLLDGDFRQTLPKSRGVHWQMKSESVLNPHNSVLLLLLTKHKGKHCRGRGHSSDASQREKEDPGKTTLLVPHPGRCLETRGGV